MSRRKIWNPFGRGPPQTAAPSIAREEGLQPVDSTSASQSTVEPTSGPPLERGRSRTPSPEHVRRTRTTSPPAEGPWPLRPTMAEVEEPLAFPRPAAIRRQSAYSPVVSSPLNPSPPRSPDGGRGSPTDADAPPPPRPDVLPRSHSGMTINSLFTAPWAPSSSSVAADADLAPPRAPGLRQERSTLSLRPHTPTSVCELGRDYSRYPPTPLRESESPTMLDGPVYGAGAASPWPPGFASAASIPLSSSSLVSLPEKADSEQAFLASLMDDRVSAPTPYLGGYQMPMFLDEKEPDDDLHMPCHDDDLRFKPRFREYLHRDYIISCIGGTLLIAGLLALFVVLPVLTYAGITGPRPRSLRETDPSAWVTDQKYPLLKNLRTGLVDPDTPKSAMTRHSIGGEKLELVFSDEFNEPDRTFYPGDDPYWTAPDIWYGATRDLEWYDPDAATTADGTLNLRLDRFENHGLEFRSGMLNSWNQLCFKGGAFEVSLSLPGPAGSPGLWPGVWTMGNLGRPGYMATTEGVWPYTYDECDIGITPNQSSSDGISSLPGQKLSSCTCPGEDHPNPGTGRGAPEIDVIEGSVDPTNRIGVVTQSLQVAPFDVWYQPNYDFIEIPHYETTQMNTWRGGPFQQAVSGTTLLNNRWYDAELYQKFAFEYTPGTDKGQIAWYVGDRVTLHMLGKSVGPNGNVGQRVVPQEPMTIVLNLGISEGWSWIDWANLTFPATMRIDYVRWYQQPGAEMVTCDPPGYPTTQYIAKHLKAYTNPNLTLWDQTGYPRPKNRLNSDC
ncbi:MAG: hypothetical protein M1815_006087 [Lichina confinis]|nr:MAG: hypothetical protein M1815_006087 [Lichina confinis]